MSDYTTELIITLKYKDGEASASYKSEGGICGDTLFWAWFMSAWETIGLDFVRQELDNP